MDMSDKEMSHLAWLVSAVANLPLLSLLSIRVRAVPDPHAGSPPVLSPRGEDVGQSELRGSPSQHDSNQWEAASAAGWAVLPVLPGDHTVHSPLFNRVGVNLSTAVDSEVIMLTTEIINYYLNDY